MNKSSYIKILLCCLVIAICGRGAYTQEEAPQEEAPKATRPDVGRQDPFSQVARDKPKSSIKKVFQSEQAEEEEEEVPELFVETVMLKFLGAKNLQTALANMTTADGAIAVDAKSNSLIISDTAENLAKIVSEIRKADKTPRQIMVEVVILDVKLQDDTEIGVNWDVLFDDKHNITYEQTVSSTLATSSVIGGDFGIITGNIVSNVVHALQEKKDVEILASPRVMMVSGQSAYIEAVDEIPYQEDSQTTEGAATITYTEFKPVGVKLTVTATLTDDNDILLTVDAEQSVQTGTTEGAPQVDTRKVRTSLLLRDSQIVIMGGLRRQEKTKEVDQIPLLGDLPIIGELFKNTKNIVKNSELVVFISPHIHKGEPPSEDEMAKFNEITNRPLLKLPEQGDTGE